MGYRRLWQAAWPLLMLANLFWAGNIVLGRAVSGVAPPVALAYWRWTGAFLVAIGFAWPLLRRDLPILVRRWRIMLLLSATGIATYNTASYIGLGSTTALNVLLLQSATPLIILVWVFALFGERPTPGQAAGVVLSLLGVAAIAGRGSLSLLRSLSFNRGDLWVFGGLVVYGVYCACIRFRPAVHPMSFLVAAMGLGSCMILPFYLAELAEGAHISGGWPAYMAMGYMAVFPSFIGYLFFNRGIELIGAARAGQSTHLMPLFGSVLAVIFLGERIHVYHVVGIALIAGGILLASLSPAPLQRPAVNRRRA